MSSRQPGDQGQHSIGHHNLEHWIRQAGRLPELADDHRPRVIEAAAESRVQMGRQRCYRLALLFVSMWLVLSSAARIADEPVRPVASRELSTIFEMRSMQLEGNQYLPAADAARQLRQFQWEVLRATF